MSELAGDKEEAIDYLAQCELINNREIFRFASRLDPRFLLPDSIPTKGETHLRETVLLNSIKNLLICPKCEEKQSNLALNILHMILFHSEYFVVVTKGGIPSNEQLVVEMVAIEGLVPAFYNIGPRSNEDNMRRAERIKDIIHRTMPNGIWDNFNVVTMYDGTKKNPYRRGEYEFWLFCDPKRVEKQLLLHLQKIDNVEAPESHKKCMKLWNFFKEMLDARMRASNFFFTNFANHPNECFILGWMFLEDIREHVSELESEIRSIFLVMYLNGAMEPSQLSELLNRVTQIVAEDA